MSHPLDISNEVSVQTSLFKTLLTCRTKVHFPLYKDLPVVGEENPKFFKQTSQKGYLAPIIQWCFLAEIVAVEPGTAHTVPLFKVKDKSGQLVQVVFHFTRQPSSFDMSDCKVGHTMCIMFACRCLFRNGACGHGIHEEDGDNVEVESFLCTFCNPS
jgi:hypothetical protein